MVIEISYVIDYSVYILINLFSISYGFLNLTLTIVFFFLNTANWNH